MLADEYGTASNIKSRVNRLSVLGAITSVQQRLKLYTKGTQAIHSPPTKARIFCFTFTTFPFFQLQCLQMVWSSIVER